MPLKYSTFITELLKARGMGKVDLAKLMGIEPGPVYEFLDGAHEPRAGIAKAAERALGIMLEAEYYGWGDPRKP